MTTRREIQIEHNLSLQFWDIREGVTLSSVTLRWLRWIIPSIPMCYTKCNNVNKFFLKNYLC